MATDGSSSTSTPNSLLISPSVSPSFSGAHHFLSIKLTTTNYLYWKTQLVPFLNGQHLLGFVDGTKPCPSANPDRQTWIDQDQMLMSLLIASLSEDVISLIIDAKTSREIWTILEASLALPSNTRILQLHLQIQNLKQDDKPVSAFLRKAKAISDELAAAGRPLSLAGFNLYVFKGLRSDFQGMVTTLAARRDDVSFSELHSLLLSHEFLHANVLSTPAPLADVSPTAHLAQRGGFFIPPAAPP